MKMQQEKQKREKRERQRVLREQERQMVMRSWRGGELDAPVGGAKGEDAAGGSVGKALATGCSTLGWLQYQLIDVADYKDPLLTPTNDVKDEPVGR